jgi:hypothetical protein
MKGMRIDSVKEGAGRVVVMSGNATICGEVLDHTGCEKGKCIEAFKLWNDSD